MYALINLPRHNCRNCGECCTVIPANTAEITEIRGYLDKHPDIRVRAIKRAHRGTCPFRDKKGRRCLIYPVRPMICRLCGVAAGCLCRYGNTAAIDGYKYLTQHGLEDVQALNVIDWDPRPLAGKGNV